MNEQFQKQGIITRTVKEEHATTRDTLEQRLNEQQTEFSEFILGVGLMRVQSTQQLVNYVEYKIAPALTMNVQPITVEIVTADTAQKRIGELSRSHHIICYTSFKFAAGQQDILVYRQGARLEVTGAMSHFGGPDDTGVKVDEGLALISEADSGNPRLKKLFNPPLAAGDKPLARRLDANKANYLACRWNYKVTPRSVLISEGCFCAVTNPATGKTEIATPVDWGPHSKTGRVTDLSPALATKLGLKTDQTCVVEVYLPKDFTLPAFVQPTGSLAAPEGSFRERLAQSALEQYKLFNGIDEHQPPLREQIKRYWDDLDAVKPGNFGFPGVSVPWSAVFVSWNVLRAAPPAATPFQYAAQHSQFVHAAIKNQTGFVGKEVDKAQPRIGDIIQNSRTTANINFAHAAANDDYPSHSAIVVGYEEANGATHALTIGGNEGDTVRRRRVRLDENGFIVQPEKNYYICVVQSPD